MADVNDSSKNKLIGEDDARQHDSSSENEIKAPKVEYDEVTWTDTHDVSPIDTFVQTSPLEQLTPKPEPPSDLIKVHEDDEKYEEINLRQLYTDTIEGNIDVKAENNDVIVFCIFKVKVKFEVTSTCQSEFASSRVQTHGFTPGGRSEDGRGKR